jgi:hypothetical protein
MVIGCSQISLIQSAKQILSQYSKGFDEMLALTVMWSTFILKIEILINIPLPGITSGMKMIQENACYE